MQARTILVGAEAHQGTLLRDDGGVVVAARNGDPGQRLVAAATTARRLVRGSQDRAQHHLLLVQAATQLAKLRTAETKQGSSGHNRQLGTTCCWSSLRNPIGSIHTNVLTSLLPHARTLPVAVSATVCW